MPAPFSATSGSLMNGQPNGPLPTPNGPPLHQSLSFPALSLFPLNDTFIPKHIALNQRVKIGRQTNAKTVPGERNGYFDSKVLSRQHAEVWEDNGKIFIKDVKSSNGTFINGERLSPEGVESEPNEMKTDDIVEFGIDIVGEDNKTIIHHKVAARVACIMNAEDAVKEQQQLAAAAVVHQQQHQQQHPPQHFQGGPLHPATRRPTLQPTLGGMGGPSRPKSTISFDHILSRLQGELNKTRETTNELHGLTNAMNEINDTLGGAVPPPSLPNSLPPIRTSPDPSAAPSTTANAPPLSVPSSGPPASLSSVDINSLHSQLSDTRSSLANHAEKVREMEVALTEHEGIKHELKALRDLMQKQGANDPESNGGLFGDGTDSRHIDSDDEEDDARSVHTVMQGDEDDDEIDERRRRRAQPGRPKTPEPGMRMNDEEEDLDGRQPLDSPPKRSLSPLLATAISPVKSDDSQLSSLASQLHTALELGRSLAAQHTAAQQTIRTLEDKVSKLEAMEEKMQRLESALLNAQDGTRPPPPTTSSESSPPGSATVEFESKILTMLGSWKEDMEGRWSGMQNDWESERKRLGDARDEWKKRFNGLEDNVGTKMATLFEANKIASSASGVSHADYPAGRHGLVTPPSPRSRSSDSNRRRKTRVKGNHRRPSRDSLSEGDGHSSSKSSGKIRLRTGNDSDSAGSLNHGENRSSSPSPASSTAFEDDGSRSSLNNNPLKSPNIEPLTPDSSFLHDPQRIRVKSDDHLSSNAELSTSAMLGFVIVGAAAVAVYWRTHE